MANTFDELSAVKARFDKARDERNSFRDILDRSQSALNKATENLEKIRRSTMSEGMTRQRVSDLRAAGHNCRHLSSAVEDTKRVLRRAEHDLDDAWRCWNYVYTRAQNGRPDTDHRRRERAEAQRKKQDTPHHKSKPEYKPPPEYEPKYQYKTEPRYVYKSKAKYKPQVPPYSEWFHGSLPGPQPGGSKDKPQRMPSKAQYPKKDSTPSKEAIEKYFEAVDAAFADLSVLQTFPTPPAWRCSKSTCETSRTGRSFTACACNVKHVFGQRDNLKTERLRWHPDKFGRCPEEYRESFQKMANEIFVVVDEIYRKTKS